MFVQSLIMNHEPELTQNLPPLGKRNIPSLWYLCLCVCVYVYVCEEKRERERERGGRGRLLEYRYLWGEDGAEVGNGVGVGPFDTVSGESKWGDIHFELLELTTNN